jgi:membrane-bound serine protease (ClpP class)
LLLGALFVVALTQEPALAQAPAAPTATVEPDSTLLVYGVGLFALALLAFVAEMLIPTGGLLGLVCAACVVGSLVAFFRYNTTMGLVAVLTYLVLWPILIVFVFRLWLHSPLARRMILGGREQPPTLPPDEVAEEAERARSERIAGTRALIGARGVAVTALRPVGMIRIEDQRVDAMSEAGIIESGTAIVVTEVYDNQVKVRPVRD